MDSGQSQFKISNKHNKLITDETNANEFVDFDLVAFRFLWTPKQWKEDQKQSIVTQSFTDWNYERHAELSHNAGELNFVFEIWRIRRASASLFFRACSTFNIRS